MRLCPELGRYDADMFYRAVNAAQPGLIRIEADELTYSLHIMVRYELERAMLHGELNAKELPERWNALYKQYLGVDVPDDARGVLQDSHWSGGQLGYFPSYALGSAYGAQLVARMKEASMWTPPSLRRPRPRALLAGRAHLEPRQPEKAHGAHALRPRRRVRRELVYELS